MCYDSAFNRRGKIDTTPLITHRFPLDRIEEAYRLFENKEDGVIKVAVTEKAAVTESVNQNKNIVNLKYRNICLLSKYLLWNIPV